MMSILTYVYRMLPVSMAAFNKIVRIITGYPRYSIAMLR